MTAQLGLSSLCSCSFQSLRNSKPAPCRPAAHPLQHQWPSCTPHCLRQQSRPARYRSSNAPVLAASRQEPRKTPQGIGLLRIPGPWWLLAAAVPASGIVGAFSIALLFGSLGLASALFWACGTAIAGLLGIAIFAPWLILAAAFTAAVTLPLTAAVGFFLYQRIRKAKLAKEMEERKANAEQQPYNPEQEQSARLAQELRDFDDLLNRRR